MDQDAWFMLWNRFLPMFQEQYAQWSAAKQAEAEEAARKAEEAAAKPNGDGERLHRPGEHEPAAHEAAHHDRAGPPSARPVQRPT